MNWNWVCRRCGKHQTVAPFKHNRDEHPDVFGQWSRRGVERRLAKSRRAASVAARRAEGVTTIAPDPGLPEASDDRRRAPTRMRGALVTNNPAEANYFTVVPKTYVTSSTMLQVAKRVTEVEWHWPEMPMEEWLDTFLYHMMKAHGVLVGAWLKVETGGSV